ncbi:MAG: hypothetical protein KAJ33_02745 [Thermoplasmata archaeon]|nr:hypothetical protein [Thermoplasmata archaeon]
MPEVTFIFPKGAILDVRPGILDGINRFKEACLSDGNVICDWELLKSYLISADVKQFWWHLTKPERFSITEKAVENTFLYNIEQYGHGDSNCEGNVRFWDTATCGHNASIRASKFSPPIPPGPYDKTDRCYYRRYPTTKEYCMRPNEFYNLPCHCALWNTTTTTHYMCAIQIDVNKSSLDNWYLFQYGSANIKHGNWQMEGPGILEIGVINWIGCNGMSFSDEVEFIL